MKGKYERNSEVVKKPRVFYSYKMDYDLIDGIDDALKNLKFAESNISNTSDSFRIICFSNDRDAGYFLKEVGDALASLEFAKSKGILKDFLLKYEYERAIIYLKMLLKLKAVHFSYQQWDSMYSLRKEEDTLELTSLFSTYSILAADFKLFSDKHPIHRPYYLFTACVNLLILLKREAKKEVNWMREAA